MPDVNRRKWITRAAALPFVGGILDRGRDPELAGPKQLAPPLPGREVLRRRYFPSLELVTSEGRKVKFYEDLLKDKIVVLNLMYAECEGVCPTILSNLLRVRELLTEQIAQNIYFYSLTIQPERDTPEKLKEYAKMHAIHDPNWLFLTGKPDDVDALRHSIGFADPNPVVDRDKSSHSGMLRYGNEPMCIWGTCQGSAKPEWIAQEIGFAVPRQFKKNPRVND